MLFLILRHKTWNRLYNLTYFKRKTNLKWKIVQTIWIFFPVNKCMWRDWEPMPIQADQRFRIKWLEIHRFRLKMAEMWTLQCISPIIVCMLCRDRPLYTVSWCCVSMSKQVIFETLEKFHTIQIALVTWMEFVVVHLSISPQMESFRTNGMEYQRSPSPLIDSMVVAFIR